MPEANKVEAMIPHTHMKLFEGEKILPEFSGVRLVLYTSGNEADYISFFLIFIKDQRRFNYIVPIKKNFIF
jgi:hypothetical protein